MSRSEKAGGSSNGRTAVLSGGVIGRALSCAALVALLSLVLASGAGAATSPSVTTGKATKIAKSSAVLGGAVNPNGAATFYRFEWGLTNGYGSMTSFAPAKAGTKPVSLSRTIRGLIPGTVYHFRLSALNRYGGSLGVDHTFKTAGNPPPGVFTGPATKVSASSAIVTALINPHNETTTWAFQYGPTTAYGYTTFGGTLPASHSPLGVSYTLQPLAARTTIHFRVVAYHNGSIAEYGQDNSFLTLPLQRATPRVRAHTGPPRVLFAPFTFTTRGSLAHPNWIPQPQACAQNVNVLFFRGRHRVAVTFVPLGADCHFAARTTFPRVPRGSRRRGPVRLRVVVRFSGNGYLQSRSTRGQLITLR